MNTLANRPYFFDGGIRFQCLRCGRCCTGRPGVVRVSETELLRIARFLDLSAPYLAAHHLTGARGHRRIREHDDGRCLYFDDGCGIYPVRPSQCRTFPFWIRNLRSRERWRRTAFHCPGIGTGQHHSKEWILDILSSEEVP